jgi:ATP/maltotriose-dependent transcriptional regulator MalT/two-component SAPR family response regulator
MFLSPRRKARYMPPRPPQGDLERLHLLEALQGNIFRKLNLICAAPGYGKTTLAAQFARSADFPVAWLQLDESDRDAAMFCEDLLLAFQFALKEWTPPPLSLLGLPASAENPGMLGSALAGALDRALSDFTVLVIDDFHLVDDSRQVLEVVNALLQEMPLALHILLLSRHVPALHVTPLVASQEAAGFNEEDLRLSAAEVQELVVGRNNISLPKAEAENLAAANEGWVTGILLSSHLLWKGLPLGGGVTGREQVFHFLASEVLEQQPEHLRSFMLEAAVLLDMEPSSCDYVLARADSAGLLSQLHTRRLFVFSSGEDQPTYRFHNLFREFLLSSLQQRQPARCKALLERAADWSLKNGFPEVAFSYFVQADNYGRAIQLAEDHVQRFYESGRFQTLLEWAKRLDPVRLEVPRLYGCVAMALGMSGEISMAEEWMEIARQGLERAGNTARLNSLQVNRIWIAYRKGEYATGLALAEDLLQRGKSGGVDAADLRTATNHAGLCAGALGRLSESVRYLRQAEAYFPEKEKSYDHAHVMTGLANALQAVGETAEAYILQRRSLAIWRELGFPGPLAVTLNNIAYDQHMMGQLAEAEATYAEAMEWSRKSGDKHSQLLIFAGQGDLKKDQRQYSAAAGYYSAAMGLAEDCDDIAMQGYLFRAMADLNRKLGNYPAALEWMRRAGSLQGVEHAAVAADDKVFRGAILEDMGRGEEALPILEEAARELEAGNAAPQNLARAFFLLSRSRLRAGETNGAEHALRRSFDLVIKMGSDQILVREAVCASDLMDTFVADPKMGGFCVSLSERANRQAITPRAAPAETESSEPLVLAVKTLGGLQITWNRREIPRSAWISQKTKEVFLFLVDRAPATRELLLRMFWPDMPPGRGQANLYQTLYRIRRAVGADILILKDQVCRFADNIILEYDVVAFEKAARRALAIPVTDRERMSELERALGFAQGEYLLDIAVDWAGQRREEINQLFLWLIREQADELLSLCRYEQARAWIARGLEVDPYRDELHQRMLKILAAMGWKHEVVDHYQKYVLLLRKDLGLDPPSETRSLYSSLIS